MQRKIAFRLFLALSIFCCAAFVMAQKPTPSNIKATVDRSCQLYKCGETAKVTFNVCDPSGKPVTSGTLALIFTNDNGDILNSKNFNLSQSNPVTISETLKFPGFLCIRAFAKNDQNKPLGNLLVGLGFEPEKIEPGQTKPADFEKFLETGKKEVRAIPIDVQKTKLKQYCNDKMDVYQISFATVNKQRVYGFLSIPKTGTGPYPLVINVPGAGPGRGPDLGSSNRGIVSLAMNVFPYPVPLNDKERRDVYNKFNEDIRYTYMGFENRDNYFFRAAYLGIDRAIDWLVSQEYIDKTHVGYYGTSQGGASALILGGMNKNIKFIVGSVPALCDHGGCLKGRASGWPKLIKQAESLKADVKKVTEAAPYLDGVNYARLIDRPIKITVGFIDTTCSPSSVYAAYNVIPSKDKEIMNEPLLGHGTGKKNIDAVNWMFEQITKK